MKCYFLGPCGSYSHQASKEYSNKFPEVKNSVEYIPCSSITEVFKATITPETLPDNVGIVPFENTIIGHITYTLEQLHNYRTSIEIVGQVGIRVDHCLMAPRNCRDISQIKYVYSHPAALGQCQQLIKEHELIGVECGSTSDAARQVAHSESDDVAVICGRQCLMEDYGDRLHLLQESVQDGANQENVTRFFVLRSRHCSPRTSAIVNRRDIGKVVLFILLSNVTSTKDGDGFAHDRYCLEDVLKMISGDDKVTVHNVTQIPVTDTYLLELETDEPNVYNQIKTLIVPGWDITELGSFEKT